MNETACKGCGAAIIWQRLNGRWHPCEPPRVTIVIDEGNGRIVSGHVSHYATCPNADDFRKSRTKPATE